MLPVTFSDYSRTALRLVTVAIVLTLILTTGQLLAQEPAQRSAPTVSGSWEYGMGLSVMRHRYKEPGLMEQSGWLAAPVVNAFIRRNDVPFNLLLEGEFARGSVDYDGHAQVDDSTVVPLTLKGLNDTFFEFRLTVGPHARTSPTTALIPYMGLGIRWWTDRLNKYPGGYLRESRYIYSPVGAELQVAFASGSGIAFAFEYDHFWKGRQKSRLSDLNQAQYYLEDWYEWQDAENDQDDGHGMRANVTWTSAPTSIGRLNLRFGLRAYLRIWKIDESDILAMDVIYHQSNPPDTEVYEVYVWEPENETLQFGLTAMIFSL